MLISRRVFCIILQKVNSEKCCLAAIVEMRCSLKYVTVSDVGQFTITGEQSDPGFYEFNTLPQHTAVSDVSDSGAPLSSVPYYGRLKPAVPILGARQHSHRRCSHQRCSTYTLSITSVDILGRVLGRVITSFPRILSTLSCCLFESVLCIYSVFLHRLTRWRA